MDIFGDQKRFLTKTTTTTTKNSMGFDTIEINLVRRDIIKKNYENLDICPN